MSEGYNLTSYLSNFTTTQVVSATRIFPLNPSLYLTTISYFAHVLFPKNLHLLFLLPTLPRQFPPNLISLVFLTISSLFFLSTHPNHLNQFFLVFPALFVTLKFLHIYLFLMLSNHIVTLDIHLDVFISATLVIISSLVWYAQHSDPYIMLSLTKVFLKFPFTINSTFVPQDTPIV